MYRLSLLAAVLVLVPSPASAAEPFRSAVKVQANGFAGSGVVIQSGDTSLVLTNRHVVESTGSNPLVWCWGEWSQGTVVRVSPDCDLALVRVQAKLPAVELAESEPASGAAIVQYSHPWHTDRIWRTSGKWTGSGTSTLHVVSGDSGSGVFHAGKLVGVTYGFPGYVPGSGLHVRLSEVRAFLRGERSARLVPMVFCSPVG